MKWTCYLPVHNRDIIFANSSTLRSIESSSLTKAPATYREYQASACLRFRFTQPYVSFQKPSISYGTALGAITVASSDIRLRTPIIRKNPLFLPKTTTRLNVGWLNNQHAACGLKNLTTRFVKTTFLRPQNDLGRGSALSLLDFNGRRWWSWLENCEAWKQLVELVRQVTMQRALQE